MRSTSSGRLAATVSLFALAAAFTPGMALAQENPESCANAPDEAARQACAEAAAQADATANSGSDADVPTEVPGSASPHAVPPPLSVEAAVDPEEAFVAALSSCHMLWFLSVAAERGLVVESYEDNAEGIMGKNAEGRIAMTKVTLRPHVKFGGAAPSDEEIDEIHHLAHDKCFIANSVKTIVTIEPVREEG